MYDLVKDYLAVMAYSNTLHSLETEYVNHNHYNHNASEETKDRKLYEGSSQAMLQ